jgi:ankyrin repeat protein
MLLERGADPTLKNKDGETALNAAASGGNTEILQMLREWKNTDERGRTRTDTD